MLYNGIEPWRAKLSLREITDEGERFGDAILNFRYSLLDVNHTYTEADLLSNDCITSIILLLDQNVAVPVLLRRLGEIVERFKSLTDGQNREIIAHWVGKSASPLLAGEMVKMIHSDRKEVPKMVSNLATAWQRDVQEGRQEGLQEGRQVGRQEGLQEGRQEGRQEGLQEGRQEERVRVIKSMAKLGADLDFIAKATETSIEEIRKLLDFD